MRQWAQSRGECAGFVALHVCSVAAAIRQQQADGRGVGVACHGKACRLLVAPTASNDGYGCFGLIAHREEGKC